MINVISTADITFIMSSSTSAWLLSLLRNKMAERFASVSEDELCEKCIIKQLNSIFAWYHELSNPRVCVICLSLRLRQITQTSVLIIHDIMLNLIQLLFIIQYLLDKFLLVVWRCKRFKEGCGTTQEEYCVSFLMSELCSWPTHLTFSCLFFSCSMQLGIWLSTCFPWAKLTLILPKTSCCCFFVSGTWPPMVSYQPMSSPWGMSTHLSTRLRVWWFIKWQVEKDLEMMNFYRAASRNFSLISLGRWLFSFSSW